jgi:hypothetical protein
MRAGRPCAPHHTWMTPAADMRTNAPGRRKQRAQTGASAPPPPAARTPSPSATAAAFAAFLVGLLYAAISTYWGLGGTWLLDTIGGTLERGGRAGTASVRVLVCTAVLLKLTAALLGLLATARPRGLTPQRRRPARQAAWATALILTLYGGVLTAIGLLVQLGVVHSPPTADHTALRWHAYLWDPWFFGLGSAPRRRARTLPRRSLLATCKTSPSKRARRATVHASICAT